MIVLMVFTFLVFILGNLCLIEAIESKKEKLVCFHFGMMSLICYYFVLGLIVAYLQLATDTHLPISKIFWY